MERKTENDVKVTDSIRCITPPVDNIKSEIPVLEKEVGALTKNLLSDKQSAGYMTALRYEMECAKQCDRDYWLRAQMSHWNPINLTTYQPPYITHKYRYYRDKVENAYMQKKIFVIHGRYESLRRALLRRGWLEKSTIQNLPELHAHNLMLQQAKPGNQFEKSVIYHMLAMLPAYFVWQPKRYPDAHAELFPYRNRIRISRDFDFTLKGGLSRVFYNSVWFTIPGLAELRVPRTFCIYHDSEEITEFRENFRLTACVNLLCFVKDHTVKEIFHVDGNTPTECIDFAVDYIKAQLAVNSHEDIDEPPAAKITFEKEEWERFFESCESVIKNKTDICASGPLAEHYHQLASHFYLLAVNQWPNMKYDGYKNLWILKPANKCRGMGIKLWNDFDKVKRYVELNPEDRFVIQKYIERPHLIYKTKFDVRQYFLVTITKTLTIWMYKTPYLRFSSQEYSLFDWCESIHLTNHSIQKKYSNAKVRNEQLPSCNMWDSDQFQNYLISIGETNTWRRKIYPGMMKSFIAALLSVQDEMKLTKNSFELYGCDYVITDDFVPYLIEINATPDLSHTTEVTRKICPAVLEDLVKVVVDYNNNGKSDTGYFHRVYSCPIQYPTSWLSGVVVRGEQVGVPRMVKPKKVTKGKSGTNGNSMIIQTVGRKNALQKLEKLLHFGKENNVINQKPKSSNDNNDDIMLGKKFPVIVSHSNSISMITKVKSINDGEPSEQMNTTEMLIETPDLARIEINVFPSDRRANTDGNTCSTNLLIKRNPQKCESKPSSSISNRLAEEAIRRPERICMKCRSMTCKPSDTQSHADKVNQFMLSLQPSMRCCNKRPKDNKSISDVIDTLMKMANGSSTNRMHKTPSIVPTADPNIWRIQSTSEVAKSSNSLNNRIIRLN